MHTEEEAKKLWCPHVRLGDEQGASASINRAWGRGCPDAASCIASKCMAWNWAGHQVQEQLIDRNDRAARDAAKADGWRYEVSYDDGKDLFIKALSDAPQVGFCGLAGRSD